MSTEHQQYQEPAAMPEIKEQYNSSSQQPPQQVKVDNHMVLYIIAFFIPALAVFMHTGECGRDTLITLLLSFLFYIPGLIYAIFIIHRDQQLGIQPKMALMQPAQPQSGPVKEVV